MYGYDKWSQVIRVWYATSAVSGRLDFQHLEDYFADFEDLEKVVFPIITISIEDIEAIDCAQELRLCSLRSFKEKYFDDLEIFDSANQRCLVKLYDRELDLGEIAGVQTLAVSFGMSEAQFVGFGEVKKLLATHSALKRYKRQVRNKKAFAACVNSSLRYTPMKRHLFNLINVSR